MVRDVEPRKFDIQDLAVSKKISFFKGRDQLFDDFCAGYFGGDIGDENQAKLELYLLLNITGAIRYKLQHSGDYNSEIENLEYAFERGTFEKLQ
jgi:hypothetical protein